MDQITTITRRQSHHHVKPKKKSLYTAILELLRSNPNHGYTARQIASSLFVLGITSSNERQAVAPRLTEMMEAGLVRVADKHFDSYSKRNVAVYVCVDS